MRAITSGIHAEVGIRQGSITQDPYTVLKVHVGDMVCTLQLPSQQYELLQEQGVDPFDFFNALVQRIGKRLD